MWNNEVPHFECAYEYFLLKQSQEKEWNLLHWLKAMNSTVFRMQGQWTQSFPWKDIQYSRWVQARPKYTALSRRNMGRWFLAKSHPLSYTDSLPFKRLQWKGGCTDGRVVGSQRTPSARWFSPLFMWVPLKQSGFSVSIFTHWGKLTT